MPIVQLEEPPVKFTGLLIASPEGALVVPPVTDEKTIVPTEVKAVPLVKAATPDVTVAVKFPPVIGTIVDWAKLGSAEKVTALTAPKMEERRVVTFMFFVW